MTFIKSNKAEIPGPHEVICFFVTWAKSIEESIYHLDQVMAQYGISFFIDNAFMLSKRHYEFKVSVSRIRLEDAKEAILLMKNRYARPSDYTAEEVRGFWSPIEPQGLSRKDHDHPWEFYSYSESSNRRDDDMDYNAFLFSDRERTVFGIREWLGNDWPHRNLLEKMAAKIVYNEDYRKSLISDDPDLPEMWKRR
ncbi:MAG: hypothetical protein AB2L14_29310 [Candidatus Xenobiia bacterium LiM19]